MNSYRHLHGVGGIKIEQTKKIKGSLGYHRKIIIIGEDNSDYEINLYSDVKSNLKIGDIYNE